MATNVHEYSGSFEGTSAHFKMTSVTGHVYTLDFPREFNNWDTVKPDELFRAPTVKIEADSKSRMCKHLQDEARNVDVLVLWLDCDREGENICFEVIKNTKHVMKKAEGKRDNIYRAKFSAIAKSDIVKAMNNLVRPNENEAKAVDARQELDLKIGCAFTRFQTRYFHGKYGNLDTSVISYGPCQTPTLAFCVARHDEILSFVPRPYWTVQLSIFHSPGREFRLLSTRGRIFSREEALKFEEKLKRCQSVKVVKVASEKKSKQRPAGLCTVELLKKASTNLGIGPHETVPNNLTKDDAG